MVPGDYISSALDIITTYDIPGDYLGSLLASLDSGAKRDLRKVRIGVRVRARDSFQKQATPEPLGQILIFWNLEPLGQILIFWNHSVKS